MAGRQISRCIRSATKTGVCVLTRRPVLSSVAQQPRITSPCITARCSAGFHSSVPRCNKYIINIQDEEDFKNQVLENSTPVIVDFHADWCGPCKMLGPRLESLISNKAGKVIMAKVDIDENSDLAIEHGVEAVPTVLAVKDGKIVDKFVGLKDDAALEKFVDGVLNE